jgi:phosphoribosylanthranilate isomerase
MALVSRALTIVVITVALLLSARFVNVTSQPTGQLQSHFKQAIVQVHKAESAGATTDEVAKLAVLLNKALELNEQALALTRPEDAQKRAQLLAQVDEMLDSVQGNATQLELVASQRTFTNNALTYISGGIGAFIATIAYAYGLSFWRKYRVKRTFQMKVIPK